MAVVILFTNTFLYITPTGPVCSKRGSLARACARGAGSHTDRRTTATCPRALSDPEDKGHGVGRGGGGDKDGDRRQKPPGRPGPAGRTCPRNYSPVCREGGGTRTAPRITRGCVT